ncbi:MAG: methionyl-tRNA formyltransferase [Bacilli bacterium]|nr:methionyl-tRNA formyltransferase [Bacilli bacterium]
MLKIIFMGTPEFSVPILSALNEKYEVVAVVTQPDKEVGRHRVLTPSPVKQYAVNHNLPVYQPEHIKEEYDNLISLGADLIVTAAYGQFVGTKLLYSPKYKAINCHASLLPKYRGGAPIHQSIKDGCDYTGVSIMYMEKKMDAGDILNTVKVEILDTDNCGTMFEKLSIAARDLLMETIPLLIEGKINPVKQDESKATFAYNITNEEKVLNFNLPARAVFNHIRAYNPSPIAYFELKGDQIKVYDSVVADETTSEAPGTILLHRKNRLMIACGEGTVIELLTIQPTGKKVMQARDFINGGLRKYL